MIEGCSIIRTRFLSWKWSNELPVESISAVDLIGFNLLVQLKGWLWWGVDENSNSSRELDIEIFFILWTQESLQIVLSQMIHFEKVMLCTSGAECILTKKTLMKLWTFKFLQMGFSRGEEKVFFRKDLKSHFVEARIQRISHHVSQKQMYGCSNQMLMQVFWESPFNSCFDG